MKNVSIFLLAAALMLSMAACSGSDNQEKETETTTPVVSEETPITPEENKEEEVDYSGEWNEWTYHLDSEDEAILALTEIDRCEYGTAGSSLKQRAAAVQMLQLTQKENWTDTVTAYMEEMSATQKDYFSFQWQMAVKQAKELLTMENVAELLEESGHGDVDLTPFTEEIVSSANEEMMTLLEEQGVRDQWKDHLDLEPFVYWEETSDTETNTNA